MSLKFRRVAHIEESWRATNLLQAGVSEALLDDDVDQVLRDRVVLVGKFRVHVHNRHLVLVNLDRTGLIPVDRVPLKSFIDLIQGVDSLS